MEIDFHFAVTYVVARLAGFEHPESLVVATSSQYVDDTVSEGTVRFKTGEMFRRISSAHEKINPKILLSSAERQVWVPFHFLPSAEKSTAEQKIKFFAEIVCRPNSAVAKEMKRLCIQERHVPFALHRLGITAHVFVDTWAHQGFSGISHPINRGTGIELYNFDAPTNRLVHLNQTIKSQGIASYLARCWFLVVTKLLNRFFPMGHGAVLHYPDWPFLKWSYVNGHGETIQRDNPRDFFDAATELHQFFFDYLTELRPGKARKLEARDADLIRKMLREVVDEQGTKRCQVWQKAIAEGAFTFGPATISYQPKGPGSWKATALGSTTIRNYFWEKFDYSNEFLSSDWKLFHDAVQAHQNQILRQVLPQFGICIS